MRGPGMGFLRAFFRSHARLALVLLAVALAARVMVPDGYMPERANGQITVRICHGDAEQTATIALPGKPDGGQQDQDGIEHPPCPYGAASPVALENPPPLWVALLFAFILVLGLRAAGPPLTQAFAHVRPPLRGPPALS